jgi:cytochrome c oxidase subunit 4
MLIMYVLLNDGTVLLGLVAWLLPIISLAIADKTKNKKWIVLSLASVSACAISLCMQLFYLDHKVRVKDWAALTDTSNYVAYASLVLLIVTIALNTITLVVYRKNSGK